MLALLFLLASSICKFEQRHERFFFLGLFLFFLLKGRSLRAHRVEWLERLMCKGLLFTGLLVSWLVLSRTIQAKTLCHLHRGLFLRLLFRTFGLLDVGDRDLRVNSWLLLVRISIVLLAKNKKLGDLLLGRSRKLGDHHLRLSFSRWLRLDREFWSDILCLLILNKLAL